MTNPHLMPKKSYQVIDTFHDSIHWTSVEKIKGHHDHLVQETFIPSIHQRDAEVMRFFSVSEPCSSLFLLHYKKPLTPNVSQLPVLLIHGASHDANMAWCKGKQGEKGIIEELSREGIEVFAISFAHSHGDNHLQAIQLANALARIQEKTGAEQIDIVAHSKGGVVARLYLSGFGEDYGIPYAQNVRKYVMLGTPNKGIDYIFRNKTPNWLVMSKQLSSPVACDSILLNGKYVDTTPQSIYDDGGAFKGQQQMLYRFDHVYPIKFDKPLYYGGQNMYFHSRGIDRAIAEGGNLIHRLLNQPVNPDVDLYVLAGNNPVFNFFVVGENSGPSDGLVLVDSVLYVDPMISNANQLKRKDTLFLNHSQLLHDKKAHEWVLSALR